VATQAAKAAQVKLASCQPLLPAQLPQARDGAQSMDGTSALASFLTPHSSTTMQSSTDSTQPLANDAAGEHDDAERPDANEMPAISEVAMRLHLLGKLILPPDAH